MIPPVKNRKEQENTVLTIYLAFILMIQFSQVLSQSVPFDTLGVNTATMHINLTSAGKLGWQTSDIGIYWRGGDVPHWKNRVVFDHGLWLSGYRQDSLWTIAPAWLGEFSPGPIIDGEAAMVKAPENFNQYRIYHITQESTPNDSDYVEWPIHWGAPHNDDGTPQINGDQTTFMVYNDAHPSSSLQGYPKSPPNPIEIHETVWDYGHRDSLSNVIFFRYQVYNRGTVPLDNVIIGHWNDIDLAGVVNNMGGYNKRGDYMFMYYDNDTITGVIPRACAYVMLQGPLAPAPGNTGRFFGQEIPDAENLSLSSGWCIYDDAEIFSDVGSFPITPEEQRNIMAGTMPDGSPLINPITGDTTTFSFDGDPITKEGWIWEDIYPGGGAGYVMSSGPFSLSAGDSNEIVVALIAVPDTTFEQVLLKLEEQVVWLRSWWEDNWNVATGFYPPQIPDQFTLYQNYPNPFNPVTTIRYELPEQTSVKLVVYDILGQEVAVLVQERQAPGIREVKFDARNLASGIYFYRLSTPTFTKTRKLVVLK